MTLRGYSGRGRQRLWRLRGEGLSWRVGYVAILRDKVRWSLGESRRGPLVLIQSVYGFNSDIQKTGPNGARPGEGSVLRAQNSEETHRPAHFVFVGTRGSALGSPCSSDGQDGRWSRARSGRVDL